MINKKHAIVVGANGLVGNEIVKVLLDNEMYDKVTLVLRRYIDIEHPKVTIEVIDFRELHKHWELFTCDDLFYCVGTTISKTKNKEEFRKIELDYCINIAKIAYHNKVKQFLYISSKGANANAIAFYPRIKGEIEELLGQIGYQSLHIFRPSVLIGQRQEFRFAESLAQFLLKTFNFMMFGFLKNIKGMPINYLATVMVRVAMNNTKGLHIYSNRRIHEFFEKG